MYEEVMKTIHGELPDVAPERIPVVFPPWVQAINESL